MFLYFIYFFLNYSLIGIGQNRNPCSILNCKQPKLNCINQKFAVSLSVEEVQMFLSLIAEERIQWELDGATRNENALWIYFLHFVYF